MGTGKSGRKRMPSEALRRRGSPLWRQRAHEEREACEEIASHGHNGDGQEIKTATFVNDELAQSLSDEARELWVKLGEQLIRDGMLDLDRNLTEPAAWICIPIKC